MKKAEKFSKRRALRDPEQGQTQFQYIRKSILFNLFTVFIISILTNSIYYNFVLNRSDLSIFHVNRLSWTSKTKPSLKSLITWSPASNYLEQSTKFKIKSYEHIFFPSFDQSAVKDDPVVTEPIFEYNKKSCKSNILIYEKKIKASKMQNVHTVFRCGFRPQIRNLLI